MEKPAKPFQFGLGEVLWTIAAVAILCLLATTEWGRLLLAMVIGGSLPPIMVAGVNWVLEQLRLPPGDHY